MTWETRFIAGHIGRSDDITITGDCEDFVYGRCGL